MQLKLSEEEKEFIVEMLESEGFKLLCSKLMPALIALKEARVMSHHIAGEADLLTLGIAKSKADGAKELASDVANLKKLVIKRDQL